MGIVISIPVLYNGKRGNKMESQKVDMRIYMADLLLLLYFILLFCERAAAVICGFVADGYVFTASADWLQWYVHLRRSPR